MINTVGALQGLYVALGGELSDVANITTIPEMLTAISTVAAAAASELPAVKSADNGKVLTVVNGKWAKAEPASVGPFVVTITATSESVTADKTYAEITAALEANQRVLMNFVNNHSEYNMESTDNISLAHSTENYYTFTMSDVGDGEVTLVDFIIGMNDVVIQLQTLS